MFPLEVKVSVKVIFGTKTCVEGGSPLNFVFWGEAPPPTLFRRLCKYGAIFITFPQSILVTFTHNSTKHFRVEELGPFPGPNLGIRHSLGP